MHGLKYLVRDRWGFGDCWYNYLAVVWIMKNGYAVMFLPSLHSS